MKTRTAAAVIALAAIVTAGACSKEMKAEWNRDKQLDKDLAAVTAGGVPGVSLVIRDGGDKTRIATGVSNVAAGTPMKVDDQVRIGSVSKTYVAVVVMQLVAEGKLTLDTTTVQQHLGAMVPNADKITVRQLLNHSSGVPNYEEHPEYFKQLLGNPDQVWTPRQLVEMGVALGGSKFAPGTDAEYSNTNYTLLGLMIEKVTGETLAQQFDRRIFGPLKQEKSSAPSGADLSGRYAHGYFVFDGPATDVTHFSPSIGYSGGGIVSTTDEVNDFYGALFAGKLVRADHLSEMMTTVTGSNGQKHGLGLQPRDLPCGTVWGHGGNFPGYLMESYVKPGGTFGVTVAYNLDPNSMQPPARDAVEALLTHSFCGAD